MLNYIVNFIKSLNSNSKPNQIANSFCIGMFLGNKKKNNVNNLKWAGMSDANTVISNNRHTITNNVPDTLASNIMIYGKSNNTKLYFMVYENNTGKDQTEQDKDGFSGIITVTATSGEKITATFN